jgi:hypothetical protein
MAAPRTSQFSQTLYKTTKNDVLSRITFFIFGHVHAFSPKSIPQLIPSQLWPGVCKLVVFQPITALYSNWSRKIVTSGFCCDSAFQGDVANNCSVSCGNVRISRASRKGNGTRYALANEQQCAAELVKLMMHSFKLLDWVVVENQVFSSLTLCSQIH